MQQVLANPQFQADPFTAIASHLAATLPPIPATNRNRNKTAKGGSKRAGGQAKQTGKRKSGVGAADAMQF